MAVATGICASASSGEDESRPPGTSAQTPVVPLQIALSADETALDLRARREPLLVHDNSRTRPPLLHYTQARHSYLLLGGTGV